jgi:hypothetical protein
MQQVISDSRKTLKLKRQSFYLVAAVAFTSGREEVRKDSVEEVQEDRWSWHCLNVVVFTDEFSFCLLVVSTALSSDSQHKIQQENSKKDQQLHILRGFRMIFLDIIRKREYTIVSGYHPRLSFTASNIRKRKRGWASE